VPPTGFCFASPASHAPGLLRSLPTLTAVSVLLLRAAAGPAAQDVSRAIPSLAGQDLFTYYCATCHGNDARGNGPVASALRTPPPDLTRLTRRNGGIFPRLQVVQFIAGGGTALRGTHGSDEMPVWGPIFKMLDPSDERLVLVRIESVVQYLESIQGE
jgi:mono/diheme cytochrome c family protein